MDIKKIDDSAGGQEEQAKVEVSKGFWESFGFRLIGG